MQKISINKVVENLFWLAVFLFSISLLFPENFRNTPLFIFLLATVLKFSTKTTDFNLSKKTFFINSILFVLLAFSLIYTKDLDYGFKRILAMMSLIIIPISFYTLNVSKYLNNEKRILIFYKLFILSNVLFFIGVFFQNYINGFLNQSIFLHFSERMNRTYGKYSLHPLYASLYIMIALSLSTKIFSTLKNSINKILFSIPIIFLIIVLFMLARKGAIAITFVIFFIYFFKRVKSQKHKLLFGLIAISFIIFSYNITPIKARYLEFYQSIFHHKANNTGSTSFRLNVYECSLESIKNQPVFGYGIGDSKQALIDCYRQKDNIFSSLYYNSHNQFLGFWLSVGVLGFLALFYMIINSFNLALKSNDFAYFSIVIIFFGMLMIENILERQAGVLLFAFFINFFAFKNTQIINHNE